MDSTTPIIDADVQGTDGPIAPPRLPLRHGVGIVLLNGAGRIWVGRRRARWMSASDPDTWLMPQGGLDHGESPLDAARRELEEETGIISVDVLAAAPTWLTWELPAALVGIALKGRYRGQCQRWFAMRFSGDEREIDISGRGCMKPEFTDWAWVEPHCVPELAAPYRRAHYGRVLATFGIVSAPSEFAPIA